MNILILDDEIYLAQKVVARLLDEGHNCENYSTVHEIMSQNKKYDAILLSTNLANNECDQLIKKYKDSIIILLVSYISDATVTNPIKAGADDYVVKPFIMDELIRKIHHFQEFNKIKQEIKLYKDYFDFTFENVDITGHKQNMPLPLLIQTNDQKYADKILFHISRKLNKPVRFIALNQPNWQSEIENSKNELLYCTDLHCLKKAVKETFINMISQKECIVTSMENEEIFPHDKIEIKNDNQILSNENIMTINDYVKLTVLSFQSKYPDTELSKKLGISRKSLWEKRKKLGIEKKK